MLNPPSSWQNSWQDCPYPSTRKKNFSITELEDYLKCPYLYYAKHHLKIEEPEDATVDLPRYWQGRLVHQVLESLYKNHLDLYKEALAYDLYLKRFTELIPPLVDRLVSESGPASGMLPVVRENFSKRASKTITEMVRREIGLIREGIKKTVPEICEWSFGRGAAPPFKVENGNAEFYLSGRVDRIDMDEKTKTFSVIDYKTGELPSAISQRNGSTLQLPFYLMAVSQIRLKNWKPASALLVGLKEMASPVGFALEGAGEEALVGKHHRLSPAQWGELQKKFLLITTDLVAKIREGAFSPKPATEDFCRNCAYRGICHYEGLENKT